MCRLCRFSRAEFFVVKISSIVCIVSYLKKEEHTLSITVTHVFANMDIFPRTHTHTHTH